MARATGRVSHRGGQPAGRPVPIDRSALVRRLADRPAFLCLDFDGTLVPIAPHPDQAMLDDAGRALLRALARVLPVAIVSGRGRATLRALVGIPSLYYVGNHGLEISGPGLRRDAAVPARWRRDWDAILTAGGLRSYVRTRFMGGEATRCVRSLAAPPLRGAARDSEATTPQMTIASPYKNRIHGQAPRNPSPPRAAPRLTRGGVLRRLAPSLGWARGQDH